MNSLSPLSLVILTSGLAGKLAIFILNVIALRLVRRAPSLKTHRSWLIWGVASSGITVVTMGLMSIAFIARIHTPVDVHLIIMFVDWLVAALVAIGCVCLLRVMIGLIRSNAIPSSSQASADAAQ